MVTTLVCKAKNLTFLKRVFTICSTHKHVVATQAFVKVIIYISLDVGINTTVSQPRNNRSSSDANSFKVIYSPRRNTGD
jgi:hypothetical protein